MYPNTGTSPGRSVNFENAGNPITSAEASRLAENHLFRGATFGPTIIAFHGPGQAFMQFNYDFATDPLVYQRNGYGGSMSLKVQPIARQPLPWEDPIGIY